LVKVNCVHIGNCPTKKKAQKVQRLSITQKRS
jgi:hypothetical protein